MGLSPSAVTVEVFVANETENNYTLVCNAETPVAANFTDLHWISPQGETVSARLPNMTANSRIDAVLTNFSLTDYGYATILNSTLSFRPLMVGDAGVWTCNVTFNLTFPTVNLSTSQDIIVTG